MMKPSIELEPAYKHHEDDCDHNAIIVHGTYGQIFNL